MAKPAPDTNTPNDAGNPPASPPPPAQDPPAAPAEAAADNAPRHLTQDQIQRFLTARLQEPKPLGEGLSPEAAAAKAKTRAAKMTGMPERELPVEKA